MNIKKNYLNMQFVDNFAKCVLWARQQALHFDKKSFHSDGFSAVTNGNMLNARTAELNFPDVFAFVSKFLNQVCVAIINQLEID